MPLSENAIGPQIGNETRQEALFDEEVHVRAKATVEERLVGLAVVGRWSDGKVNSSDISGDHLGTTWTLCIVVQLLLLYTLSRLIVNTHCVNLTDDLTNDIGLVRKYLIGGKTKSK